MEEVGEGELNNIDNIVEMSAVCAQLSEEDIVKTAFVETLEKLRQDNNTDSDSIRMLTEILLPIIYDALPELLRKVQERDQQLSGEAESWHHDKSEIKKVFPLRWLASYLYRHNRKKQAADGPALRALQELAGIAGV